MAPKFNPFKPHSIVHTGMFVGRYDEIRAIERCLFQGKNENPVHFLVNGERGIGKSSLFFTIEKMADGQIDAITTPERFKFLTVSIDLGGCSTQMDVVSRIGRGLKSAIAPKQKVKEAAKGFWDWITNWEVLGVQYHKEDDDSDPELAAEELVHQLAAFCAADTGLDGILILIDEADGPDASAGLGSLLKTLTERLIRSNCNKVLFGLAGLPSLITKLRDSHESSPRLFQSYVLEPLEVAERARAVEMGLSDGNQRGNQQITITQEALDYLAELSEGYPHFLQQFAFCAFERDTDNVIDEDDVTQGAFGEGGALSQLGDRFFKEMYHARIGSENYRRVLDAMADYGDKWVVRKDIIQASKVSTSNVNNALATLKAKGIILQDETRQGYYRLPTNSFAAWINAVRSAREKNKEGASAQL